MNDLMDALNAAGFGSLFTRYSPNTNEARLDRPLFLFYALDDASAPEIAAFGERLKAAGKPVTVSTVPSGGHVQAMARDGLPAAIAWLKEQGQ
jgi:acetyl esterase/lipase